MADIKVQRADAGEEQRLSKREVYARVAFYYPRYSLKELQELPARDLNLLLKTARKENALKMKDLLMIVTAPHAKDKNAVKNLVSHFEKLAKD